MPSAELRDTPDHDPALFTTGMAGEKASEATTSAAIAAILSAVGMVFQTISVQMWCEIGDKSPLLPMRAPTSVWGLLLLSALFLSSDNMGSGTNAMEVSFCRMIQRAVDREGAAWHCILHNPRALATRVGWKLAGPP